MIHEGFLWQATYRIEHGVPVVLLYGRLNDGRPFLVRDDRQRPHFFVPASQRAVVAALVMGDQPAAANAQLLECPKQTMAGEPVLKVQVAVPPDVPPLRDRLHAAGIPTFEADVRFAVRYCFERELRGGLAIHGEPLPTPEAGLLFVNPDLAPAAVEVEPRVLSFDIETNARADRILAVAYQCGPAQEVLLVETRGRALPPGARGFPRQRDLLAAFAERVATLDPDVLTGWNVIDFDLRVMDAVARRTGQPLLLGRGAGALRLRPPEGFSGSGSAQIPGRLVLDGLDLVRGAFVRLDDYSLDAVARQVLGEGKTIGAAGAARVAEIHRRYREDLPSFVSYAATDARLVLEILEKLDLIPLALARSRLTGMTPDRVAASIASFDFLYLGELHQRQRVAPTVRAEARLAVSQAGGQVYEPLSGVHDQVAVFDFKSLYPSIIRTFNIDPLGFVAAADDEALADDLLALPGARFQRAPGILPALLDDLFDARQAARDRGDAVASQAIKILMNSFYGVLGTPACRFHNAAIANAITGQGRYLLGWMKSWFESEGLQVLYGDTDSLFVCANGPLPLDEGRARTLAALANRALNDHVRAGWQVESRLELEFEKLYSRLFLPPMRTGRGTGDPATQAGARKRYVGLKDGELEFVGMEVVRRDWTELAKNVQRALYRCLFAGEPVSAYLQGTVAALRRGELDEQLVYRKGLRKDPASYTAGAPPHVVAARKSRQPPGRVVAYVMTTAGPEPLDNLQHPPDRAHYLERQIRPVAEPVLDVLGLRFDAVVGDDTQLGLFP